MKFSKSLFAFLLAAMLLGLVACGQQDVPQTPPPSPEEQGEPAETPETAPEEIEIPDDGAVPEENAEPAAGGTLVIYFSATGSTKAVAGYIAGALGADTYAITPEAPYSSDDLDWRDPESRVSQEHEDPDARPAIAGELPALESYSTIFLGYPLWWGEAPHVVCTFLESVNLSGKTVIPFCTSSSSGLGESAEHLHALAPDAAWQEGIRFPSRAEETDVTAWVDTLALAG